MASCAGLTTAALLVGRLLVRERVTHWVAFSVGLLVLRAIDLVPVAGFVVTLGASTNGLGALLVVMG